MFFIFHPDPWKFMIQFDEHIFQMGWFNHQLSQLLSLNSFLIAVMVFFFTWGSEDETIPPMVAFQQLMQATDMTGSVSWCGKRKNDGQGQNLGRLVS